MPSAALMLDYPGFQAAQEPSNQLYARQDNTLYWQQGREVEGDVLIPVTAAQLSAQLAAFLMKQNLPLISKASLVMEVEWSDIQHHGTGYAFASRHQITIHRYNPGETLQRLRKNAGLSRDRLAAKSGVTAKTIQRIEQSKTHALRPDTATRLARALGVGTSDLGLPIIGGAQE